MYLKKIIKVYFFFILTLVTASSLIYKPEVERYLVSVLNAQGIAYSSVIHYETEVKELYNSAEMLQANMKIPEKFMIKNSNPNKVSFEIADGERMWGYPGDTDNEILKFEIRTFDKEFILNDLKLKIEGVEGEMIVKSYLKHGDVFISAGKNGDHLEFKDIGYLLAGGSDDVISVFVDLSAELRSNRRIKLVIENPEDINILVGGRSYYLNQYYPIESGFFTIAKMKPKKEEKEKL